MVTKNRIFIILILILSGMKNKIRRTQFVILLIVLGLLLIPLLEQFDGNATFDWGPFDFVLAFLLILTLGFGIEFFVRRIKSRQIKWLAIPGIILFFVLLWAELAVGIFNTPIAGD